MINEIGQIVWLSLCILIGSGGSIGGRWERSAALTELKKFHSGVFTKA